MAEKSLVQIVAEKHMEKESADRGLSSREKFIKLALQPLMERRDYGDTTPPSKPSSGLPGDPVSSVSKEAWVQHLSAKQLMWHGTSARYVRTILKEGLKLNSNEKNFGWNNLSPNYSMTTHGGVYLANDIDEAIDYADDYQPLFVGVQVETTAPAVMVDEDHLADSMKMALKLNDQLISITSIWEGRPEPRSQSAAERLALAYAKKQPPSRFLQIMVSKYRSDIPDLQKTLDRNPNLEKLVMTCYQALVRYYAVAWWKLRKGQPVEKKLYQDWADALKVLSKALKVLVQAQSTLRIGDSIGFSGSTKIVFIGAMWDVNSYRVKDAYHRTSPMEIKVYYNKDGRAAYQFSSLLGDLDAHIGEDDLYRDDDEDEDDDD